jgi:carbamoyl-phosphate synthase large subunit
MNILITSAGRRVSLVRAFQKELNKVNYKAKVFAADANPIASSACHAADDFFKVPRLDDPTYFEVLESICTQNNITLVIPTIDTELLPLSNKKKEFLEKGILFLVSDHKLVEKCRDKRQIHDFFEENGVHIAKEYSKDNFEIPLFIKPVDGSRSVDTYLITDKSQLTDYHFQNKKLMFLEYIDHDQYEEYTCDMYYDREHKLKCVVPRKRIEVRDGEVNKGLTSRNEIIPYLRERLSFIEGAVGCLTAQFFLHKTNGKVYGIEINPRFGGGYPLSYRAGANFPAWIIAEYFKQSPIDDHFSDWEDQLLMLRYDDEILVHGYKG